MSEIEKLMRECVEFTHGRAVRLQAFSFRGDATKEVHFHALCAWYDVMGTTCETPEAALQSLLEKLQKENNREAVDT